MAAWRVDEDRPVDEGSSEWTDEELAELALAADPAEPLDPGARPISFYLSQLPGPLPAWYMPAATARARSRWRAPVVVAIVAAFLLIDAFGLCNTFGVLTL